MGIKASTGFAAGVPNYVPGGPPSVPAGYARYETDIATANTTAPSSLLFGLTVEDGTQLDVPDYLVMMLVALKATGFFTLPAPPAAPAPPLTFTYYVYTPGTGAYDSRVATVSAPGGGGGGGFLLEMVSARIIVPLIVPGGMLSN